MKIYLSENVYEAALNRIRRIFDEFENISVSFSGGKDSTVILELALIVAKEKNRLPLKVMFLDQESEWQSTINYIDEVMRRKEIEPYWMQVPFRLFNSSSFFEGWLHCWDEKEKSKWMREKSDISYKENVFGTDRFKEILGAINDWLFKGKKFGIIYGLKANESQNRRITLTTQCRYEDITWSSKEGKNGYKFAPLYDWADDDIWTAIGKFNWKYNKIYDEMFKYGESPSRMRCSSLIHETAAEHSLLMLQELEPQTYERLTQRIGGVSTYSKLMKDVHVQELPVAFSSWKDYLDYLLEKVANVKTKKDFERLFNSKLYALSDDKEAVSKVCCNIVLSNDWTGTKVDNLQRHLDLKKKVKEGHYERKYQELIT